MEASQLNIIAIQIAYIMVLVFIFMGFLIWWRIRLGKRVGSGEFIICEIIPRAGKARTEILRITDGKIKVKPIKGRAGKTFVVKDLNTYMIDYPSLPRWLSFLQVSAAKIILDEGSAEPITNRFGIGGITPEFMYALEEGITAQCAIAMSHAEKEAHQKVETQKKGGFSWTWVIISAIVLAVVIIATVLVKKFSEPEIAFNIGNMLWLMI